MELFYGGGGASNPHFSYTVRVKKMNTEAFDWCSNYPDDGKYFRRWYVEWQDVYNRDYDVVQFEWEEPAIMFALRFGHI